MSVFQDLYDSEINFQIRTFWDGGFDVDLGDPMNGVVETKNFATWGLITPWLIEAATRNFPGSMFAQRYRDNLATWRTSQEMWNANKGSD